MEPITVGVVALLIFGIYSQNSRAVPKPEKTISDIEHATTACESGMLRKFEKGALTFECGKIESETDSRNSYYD